MNSFELSPRPENKAEQDLTESETVYEYDDDSNTESDTDSESGDSELVKPNHNEWSALTVGSETKGSSSNSEQTPSDKSANGQTLWDYVVSVFKGSEDSNDKKGNEKDAGN